MGRIGMGGAAGDEAYEGRRHSFESRGGGRRRLTVGDVYNDASRADLSSLTRSLEPASIRSRAISSARAGLSSPSPTGSLLRCEESSSVSFGVAPYSGGLWLLDVSADREEELPPVAPRSDFVVPFEAAESTPIVLSLPCNVCASRFKERWSYPGGKRPNLIPTWVGWWFAGY
jgi:hypothetical protein